MKCVEFSVDLSSYLDDELPNARHLDLHAHLATCRACRERLDGYRGLKHAVARLPARAAPPEAVRARIEALRYAQTQRRLKRRWLVLGGAGAMVAGLAVTTLVAIRQSATPPGTEVLINDHLRYGPDVMPAEVASPSASEVREFFDGKLPFAAVVPEIPGASLIGGRLCRIEGRSVELLFYDHAGATLSLYVSDRAGLESCAGSRGYHVCSRTRGRLTYTIVGGLPPAELEALLEGTR